MGFIKRESIPEDNVRKKQASELLKNADRLLKEGRYTEALEEVEKTLGLDPKNFYAKAYKERIAAAMQGKNETGTLSSVSSPAVPKPDAETQPDSVAARKQKETEELKKILPELIV